MKTFRTTYVRDIKKSMWSNEYLTKELKKTKNSKDDVKHEIIDGLPFPFVVALFLMGYDLPRTDYQKIFLTHKQTPFYQRMMALSQPNTVEEDHLPNNEFDDIVCQHRNIAEGGQVDEEGDADNIEED